MKRQKKAFTLVELLVVIAIIGILFVVLISKVDFATDKAKTAGVQTDFRSYQMAMKMVGMEQQGFTNDMNKLAEQLNKNLDPKLQVSVSDGALVTDAEDPWGTEYTITYSEPENARGKIIITSAGADRTVGTDDDYNIVIEYAITSNGGSVNIEFVEGHADGVHVIPKKNPDGTIDNYSWDEIQTLARLGLTAEEYKNDYGIELGQKVDDTYTLVDFDNYGGFVFIYQSGQTMKMNNSNTNAGGYAKSAVASQVEALYESLDAKLKLAIKEVTIKCNNGTSGYAHINTYTCHLFLPSHSEIGGTGTGIYPDSYDSALPKEGEKFDYFISDNSSSEANARRVAVGGSVNWWTRSADCAEAGSFWYVKKGNAFTRTGATSSLSIMPAFVIG